MSQFGITNTNTPEYNDLDTRIAKLDIRYGPNKPIDVKEIVLYGGLNTDPSYIPTPLNWYEVYNSGNTVNWYAGVDLVATNTIAIVRCGGLITLCLPEIYVQISNGPAPLISSPNTIPSRFLPGVLLNGMVSSCTFPILTISCQVNVVPNKNGRIVVNVDGSITIYSEVDNIGFPTSIGCASGILSTYLSWNR